MKLKYVHFCNVLKFHGRKGSFYIPTEKNIPTINCHWSKNLQKRNTRLKNKNNFATSLIRKSYNFISIIWNCMTLSRPPAPKACSDWVCWYIPTQAFWDTLNWNPGRQCERLFLLRHFLEYLHPLLWTLCNSSSFWLAGLTKFWPGSGSKYSSPTISC